MKREADRLVAYDPNCRACPRLASFLGVVKTGHPTYSCKPVPPFGDSAAQLLIVGLAPGLHGANATGRPKRCSTRCCNRFAILSVENYVIDGISGTRLNSIAA